MTRNELYNILLECNGDNIAALETIWGQTFDGLTKKIPEECPDHGINPKLCKWMRHAPLIPTNNTNLATSPNL